jgi:hypothetical protein
MLQKWKMERTVQQMLRQLLANQEKANVDLEQMKADRIADREYMKQMMGRTDGN